MPNNLSIKNTRISDFRIRQNGLSLLDLRICSCKTLFNWAAFYKPNSLPSSTVGSSSAPGLIGARARRT